MNDSGKLRGKFFVPSKTNCGGDCWLLLQKPELKNYKTVPGARTRNLSITLWIGVLRATIAPVPHVPADVDLKYINIALQYTNRACYAPGVPCTTTYLPVFLSYERRTQKTPVEKYRS